MLTQEDYWMIRELHERGLYRKDIADRLGVHPKTVTRVRVASFKNVPASTIDSSVGISPSSPPSLPNTIAVAFSFRQTFTRRCTRGGPHLLHNLAAKIRCSRVVVDGCCR